MFSKKITLDEYLSLDNYSLEWSGRFRAWLGKAGESKRSSDDWDKLAFQFIDAMGT